jgi:ubiquinone/menaquinone biosynthesis C-methylase UbiE
MVVFIDKPSVGASRSEMIDFFRKLLIAHGPNTPQALGWKNQASQEARHRILTREIAPGSRVIDFGCGLGDLYVYLKKVGLPVSYQGFDIVHETVKAARRKYPGVKFSTRGSLKGIAPKSCDHIIACGAFTYRVTRHFNYLLRQLADFTRVARRGFSLDLFDINETNQIEEGQYFAIDRATLERILKGLDFEIETSPVLGCHFVFVRLDPSALPAAPRGV